MPCLNICLKPLTGIGNVRTYCPPTAEGTQGIAVLSP